MQSSPASASQNGLGSKQKKLSKPDVVHFSFRKRKLNFQTEFLTSSTFSYETKNVASLLKFALSVASHVNFTFLHACCSVSFHGDENCAGQDSSGADRLGLFRANFAFNSRNSGHVSLYLSLLDFSGIEFSGRDLSGRYFPTLFLKS